MREGGGGGGGGDFVFTVGFNLYSFIPCSLLVTHSGSVNYGDTSSIIRRSGPTGSVIWVRL